MSKRELKKYLSGLTKDQVEEQFLEVYDKFRDVKTYYDFIFNPKEDKLIQESKAKISNEYFPLKSKRARLRRSVAQKYIKHFLLLGVDPYLLADVMLYSIEVAQKYSAKRQIRYTSFYTSMLKSFEQAVSYIGDNGMNATYLQRITAISEEASRQRWENAAAMRQVAENSEARQLE
ncbi:MAG TPA: DUF6155 family protein [Flavobacterium sp.]|jgi:hypothetical protein